MTNAGLRLKLMLNFWLEKKTKKCCYFSPKCSVSVMNQPNLDTAYGVRVNSQEGLENRSNPIAREQQQIKIRFRQILNCLIVELFNEAKLNC